MSNYSIAIQPKPKVTSLLYSQFLINSHINYTCDYMAKASLDFTTGEQVFSGDSVERFLKKNKFNPRLLWENIKIDIIQHEDGVFLFYDTVLDHNSSSKIENVRTQWSGNEHKIIRGIGVITCVYYNPSIDQFWIIDYRIYDPERDGKKKTEHVMDMYDLVILNKQIQHKSVHVDAAYATNKVLAKIDSYQKIFYCNIRSNRLALDLSEDIEDDKKISKKSNYKAVKDLDWNENNLKTGKLVRLNKAPARAKVKLFRVTSSNRRTDYLITNDLSTNNSDDIQNTKCSLDLFQTASGTRQRECQKMEG